MKHARTCAGSAPALSRVAPDVPTRLDPVPDRRAPAPVFWLTGAGMVPYNRGQVRRGAGGLGIWPRLGAYPPLQKEVDETYSDIFSSSKRN